MLFTELLENFPTQDNIKLGEYYMGAMILWRVCIWKIFELNRYIDYYTIEKHRLFEINDIWGEYFTLGL